MMKRKQIAIKFWEIPKGGKIHLFSSFNPDYWMNHKPGKIVKRIIMNVAKEGEPDDIRQFSDYMQELPAKESNDLIEF